MSALLDFEPRDADPAMSAMSEQDAWREANRAVLVAALDEVRALLEAHAAGGATAGSAPSLPPVSGEPEGGRWDHPDPPRLEQLCRLFHLSSFERRVLLLAAGVELETAFAHLCARAQGAPDRPFPTFSLALAAFPDAHWSALSPDAPLRWWRLVEPAAGAGLTGAALQVDERVLHYLLGVDCRDEGLAGLAEPVPPPAELPPSQLALARRIAATWNETAGSPDFPVVQLCGPDGGAKRAVAAGLAALLDLVAYRMPADALPLGAADLERVLRLWQREAALAGGVLVLDCDAADGHDAAREGAVRRVVETVASPLVLTGAQRRRLDPRPALVFEVDRPDPDEQRDLWRRALAAAGGAAALPEEQLERLVGQFHLSASMIQAACAAALGTLAEEEGAELATALWRSCRLQARPRLDDLAQRIAAAARWEDLVLPEGARLLLREIVAHVRWRHLVHRTWGFEARGARGLGIAALFAGASGTGKTMAAEAIAGEVGLDLYRIDLSAVVSKYIGETEKNLSRVFDAAESGGAILLFDEADALFGKRTEVQDSHDRYANIEVSYLLQRMESYRGLAVLTSNLKESLDAAFVRRFRFIVDFPFPGLEQRAAIWARIFPPETPTETLDPRRLARLNLAGGSIRNIALNAAFLAADAGEAVGMRHLARAARREYAKLGQPLPELEVQDWA